MSIITLTTDFGTKDGFVAAMKGVIWSINPAVQIADVSHEITPQNILEGALTLWRAYSFFPAGTVHVFVVDPGVGTSRRPIAVRLGEHFFVGPDNGWLTPMLEDDNRQTQEDQIIHLTNSGYFLENRSHTFHGRDFFAPVAAHLSLGISLREMGDTIEDLYMIDMTIPIKTKSGWRAHLVMIDHFGNCMTDLPASLLKASWQVSFSIRGRKILGVENSYGSKKKGELIALADSSDRIEIAVVNGNAADELGAQVGDLLEVTI
jgi:S-adenosylmethionine hydrolase